MLLLNGAHPDARDDLTGMTPLMMFAYVRRQRGEGGRRRRDVHVHICVCQVAERDDETTSS